MKTAAILSLLAGSAAAFAPAPVNKAATSLKVSADLDGMVGTSAETGNKVVSCLTPLYFTNFCKLETQLIFKYSSTLLTSVTGSLLTVHALLSLLMDVQLCLQL